MKDNRFIVVISGIILGCVQASIIIAMLVIPNLSFNSSAINSFFNNKLISNEHKGNFVSTFFKNNQINKNGELKQITVYNGVTVDEGVKSNKEINKKAVELTQKAKSDREKAKILYTWVANNVMYDNQKAKEVLEIKDIDKMPKSGAIPAFKSRTGICFDKACLYVAMCRATNLKVRLIGGQAFDGQNYVGHAWNQVYLPNEEKWINVDTTFGQEGDYFDSNLFDKHKQEELAGEW
ncbi:MULTISPECIES: transglutaminase-like domain-containing protein [Clostridium]|uniref:Transglutaminase domain-containing protein n=1 Tax=Clostridium saccharoperbutylacetonicum N1-4(HMT) TaxID=931276 RepID=M1MT81_9CLOT|nr:transglutaminase-like domain-containing protein [Clostridium saccharoperbutylacetonicum]AGF57931.1 transglutaminase domain-containing protein [Clostridium saccharoperbutylacetonicum N1-4(HMT)]AQR96606.1 transglutaminase-like superfamily protein [Clostridium saccharoperbutylacetonicum]NRT61296.1 transglutaminase/protease-like cytokinesis protein 3 [Clostridium saccharoperbutylacetonicum]NSB24613.1 transglutaminase/protease-like cytokinesis protein 3 [Clostridium saccharoperbutylacetonicum]NS